MLAASAWLSGCALFTAPTPGVVEGVVHYNGEPAAGKRVSLAGKQAITDAQGRYRFTGTPPGSSLRVTFLSGGDRAGVLPNEVAQWRSLPFELSAGDGAVLPPFDVSHNGPLYPDVGMALLVGPETPVPFHWSTHRQARAYRLLLTGADGQTFTGDWKGEPTAVFSQKVTPGSYFWRVEIDGGAAGTGLSRERAVDL